MRRAIAGVSCGAMLRLRNAINEDLGQSLLDGLVDEDERFLFGAAYATFDDNLRTGYYPVLVKAVHDAATAGEKPLLQHAYERIVADVGPDPWAMARSNGRRTRKRSENSSSSTSSPRVSAARMCSSCRE